MVILLINLISLEWIFTWILIIWCCQYIWIVLLLWLLLHFLLAQWFVQRCFINKSLLNTLSYTYINKIHNKIDFNKIIFFAFQCSKMLWRYIRHKQYLFTELNAFIYAISRSIAFVWLFHLYIFVSLVLIFFFLI